MNSKFDMYIMSHFVYTGEIKLLIDYVTIIVYWCLWIETFAHSGIYHTRQILFLALLENFGWIGFQVSRI